MTGVPSPAARPVIVGAVIYDPRVSVIWDIIRGFFEQRRCPTDVVFYTNYELQVEALLAGHLDIAWNSPLAWLDAQRRSDGRCRAIAMRDTDRDRVSHIIARVDGPASVEQLRGKVLAVGAGDSPQATLIPIGLLQRAGLEPGRDFEARRHDVLLGKHGDHIGGELDALHALQRGEVDATTMLDLNWERWSSDGTIDPNAYRVIATTDRFDHCVFTTREDFDADREHAWLEVLMSMSYDDPTHREMMDLEGLRAWEPGRTSGFEALSDAVERQHFWPNS